MRRRWMASLTASTKSISLGGAPTWAARFHCCDGLGTQGEPAGRSGKPQAHANAGHACSQALISRGDRRQSVRSSAISSSAAAL
jgi:hypothetical protein